MVIKNIPHKNLLKAHYVMDNKLQTHDELLQISFGI